MALFGRSTEQPEARTEIVVGFEAGGLTFAASGSLVGTSAVDWLAEPQRFTQWELVAYLSQLDQEGWGPTLDDRFILPWDSLYALKADPGHRSSLRLLPLPDPCGMRPALTAHGSLTDPDFEITLSWEDGRGRPAVGIRRVGGVLIEGGRPTMLSEPVWRLAEEVRRFAERDDHSGAAHRQAWGRLRRLAFDAGASLDDFLDKSVVVTLETLDLGLDLVEIQGTRVVEVIPKAEGVPTEAWVKQFDRASTVRDHYDLALADGTLMRVVPDAAVKEVLHEIKRMPGRRVAGRRAQMFLRNPYTLLGEAMAKVLPPERFEALRHQAGIRFLSFTLAPVRDDMGRIERVDLILACDSERSEPLSPLCLADKEAVHAFATLLARAVADEAPCLSWKGHDLDLQGGASGQLAKLTTLLAEPWATPQPVIDTARVFNLARYCARATGFDVYKPVHSPFIQKTDREGTWLPDDIEPVISWHPPGAAEPVRFMATRDAIADLASRLETARARGEKTLVMPEWPAPIGLSDAQAIVEAYRPLLPPANGRGLTGLSEEAEPFGGPAQQTQDTSRRASIQLLIGENIERSDYAEDRGTVLVVESGAQPSLPRALRGDIGLKPHQAHGVSWLQALWRNRDRARGCLFADDMGLGKTLQLLTFLHRLFEDEPAAPPALVVAPVSLLENWQAEISRFFTPADALRPMVLHGRGLDQVKVKKAEIAPELLEKGMARFLRPEWRGDARLVLTTYETLRDHEVSLAAERWSVLICDEAQRIKTPNALVTRAAKKQNAMFRVACTGTPVENSLTDLWCLFDFIQPGLLGPLNEFGRIYVRPIEAKTDAQIQRVEDLRALIRPQLLRRTKAEVADLPPKHENSRRLPISARQLSLYGQAVEKFKARQASDTGETGGAGTALLGMLHTLRLICADPHHPKFAPPATLTLDNHCRHSPKIEWLLGCLDDIRTRGEKAIVFTEFRDVQRLLQRAIAQRFGLTVRVINGDTKVQSVEGAATRQRLIDDFQAEPGFNVIILSTTAIGFGVNIQAANHVIHFTRAWNPAKEDQATDRAYRIGQERPVHVHYPTIVSETFQTFEDRLDQLLSAKRRLAGDMLNGSADIEVGDFVDLARPDGETIIADEPIGAEHLTTIDPASFERLCERLWAAQGFLTYRTPASGDGGIDIVAIQDHDGWLIQCKSSSRGTALGWEGVKDVVAGAPAYRQRHPHVTFRLVVATNSTFNETACQQATLNNVTLVDGYQISSWLGQWPVTLGDIL